MKRLGTDVRAVAGIGVGAALSMVATLAVVGAREAPKPATADCIVEVRHTAPNVVVAVSSGREAVVVTPNLQNLQIESAHHCTTSAGMIDGIRIQEIRVDVAQEVEARVREALQEAREGWETGEHALGARMQLRVELERARERIDHARVRVEGIEDFDFDELEVELDETFEIELEQRLEDAMERVEVGLERLEDEVGT